MKVRDAQKDDINELSKLYTSFCQEFNVPIEKPPNIENGKVIVYSNNFCLLGYGNAFPYEYGGVKYTYGEHIYVKPEFRNMGIGTKIYRALRKWARQEGRPIILSSSKAEHAMWWSKGYRTLRFIMVKEIKCTK